MDGLSILVGILVGWSLYTLTELSVVKRIRVEVTETKKVAQCVCTANSKG